jgi:enamine deaminase RidA (YjgF/YER057c/UK114 family)
VSVYERMKRLGLSLPDLAPTYEFLRVNFVDDLVFVSGHAPYEDGQFKYRGKIGRELDLLAGQRAAESALLGCLASLQSEIGSLESVRQIVKLNGYVNCVQDFQDLPQVTDAASRLLVQLFGDSGRHARTTVGVMSLPMGVAVEIELVARISGAHQRSR